MASFIKLIEKYYPNGCALFEDLNPSFEKDETWESFQKKRNVFLKEIGVSEYVDKYENV
jgi:hypothetical protein